MTKTPALVCCASILLSTVPLVGCGNKEPTGQVVALVDGEEVTRRDLATEPTLDQSTGAGDQPALLRGVIDRKLAVAEARRLSLDRTPEYVAQAQRVEEVMLSRTLFARWADALPQASPKAIAEYIAGNPQRFGERKLFLVDRIEAAASAFDPQAFAPLQTADVVAQHLSARSQAFQRSRLVMDSATLSPELYRRLRDLRSGYPIAIPQGDKLIVLAMLEARDAPLPQAEQNAAAVAALKQVAIQGKLADLRKNAKVAYQAGYRPAAPPQ
jgi:EpsD family peptidyl-prolyl cis-trans isomerase